MSSSGRRALERASAPLLVRLSTMPAWLVPLIMAVLAVVGLIVGGVVGFVALTLIAAFLAWLALLSWPVLRPRQRLLRSLAVAIVIAAAVVTLAVG
jgi:hypothetical protein